MFKIHESRVYTVEAKIPPPPPPIPPWVLPLALVPFVIGFGVIALRKRKP